MVKSPEEVRALLEAGEDYRCALGELLFLSAELDEIVAS
jgi:hypothetical protein